MSAFKIVSIDSDSDELSKICPLLEKECLNVMLGFYSLFKNNSRNPVLGPLPELA
jgi:hypothetical protein